MIKVFADVQYKSGILINRGCRLIVGNGGIKMPTENSQTFELPDDYLMIPVTLVDPPGMLYHAKLTIDMDVPCNLLEAPWKDPEGSMQILRAVLKNLNLPREYVVDVLREYIKLYCNVNS
jgi:hypothetical protein